MDAVASLRPCAVDVTLGEWIYTIPERSAVDWIEAVLDEDGSAIVPGLMDEVTAADVWRQYAWGRLSPEDIVEGARAALGAAAGRTWWSADRLIRSAAQKDVWPIIHGRLIAEGMDLEKASIGAFCNAVYAKAVDGGKDDTDKAKLDFELNRPPPGIDPDEIADDGELADDFMAALEQDRAMHGGLPV